ncbi:MAG: 16S rRNA (guanine(527)-N(7))-methyltransferase RsmG [Burkholderiales bacterium]|jgi:16S rRNA (guanine527-N7)-methyltransferase|nr:16S rRNA (guanine(527)-N(7))-methyltransferase RsmG [Burkholderiales bacterium]
MTPAARLDRGLAGLGIALPADARQRLLDYLALLAKWNAVYNLTAIRDPDQMVSNHLLDSLAIIRFLPSGPLLDVGAGAGLPGIPVAIARPAMAVTLVDSSQKKAAFLQQAAAELGLANVTALHARVESWHPGSLFPAIVSRAFAELADFVRLTRHLLAPGGAFYAMKGRRPADEIARLPQGFRVRESFEVTVPELDAERCLIVIEAAP